MIQTAPSSPGRNICAPPLPARKHLHRFMCLRGKGQASNKPKQLVTPVSRRFWRVLVSAPKCGVTCNRTDSVECRPDTRGGPGDLNTAIGGCWSRVKAR